MSKKDKSSLSETCQIALKELGRAERIELDFDADEIMAKIKNPRAKVVVIFPETETKH